MSALTLRASLAPLRGAPLRAPAPRATMQAGDGFSVLEMPGITAPLGFWDPLGFSEGESEGAR